MKDTTHLERMLDETYIYKGKQIKIKDWYHEEEKDTIRIITTTAPIVIKHSDVSTFVKACLPIEDSVALSVINENKKTITTLSEILMDNITKVQKDPKYIDQAKVINSSVNAMMSMVNLQLKIHKASKG